jgi:hypothetical protein
VCVAVDVSVCVACVGCICGNAIFNSIRLYANPPSFLHIFKFTWASHCLSHSKFSNFTETWVDVRPALPSWSTLEPDKIVVRALDVGNVRVISHVLGQSVALDHYNR